MPKSKEKNFYRFKSNKLAKGFLQETIALKSAYFTRKINRFIMNLTFQIKKGEIENGKKKNKFKKRFCRNL